MTKVYQCCYTNATQEMDGKSGSGWRTVAVSEGIAHDALEACTKQQVLQSSIQGSMVDESGRPLNLYEVIGDGTYVISSRAQYGLLDRVGRQNMFSHAYVMSWDDAGVLDDPNTYLSIARDSYKSSYEEALTVVEPQREDNLNVESALAASGMTRETYQVFIRCLYAMMALRKVTEPLYVQCGGGDEQVRALLYCAYAGLPITLRRRLSAASCETPNTSVRNIVFSTKAAEHANHFDPSTGANDVITKRIAARIARAGYVDYFARNYDQLEAVGFYGRLDSMVAKIGGDHAADELLLKTAYYFLVDDGADTLSDEELDERVSDVLRVGIFGNDELDQRLSLLLAELAKRGRYLGEANEGNLSQRAARSTNAALVSEAESYNIRLLGTLDAPEAARRLDRMDPHMRQRCIASLAAADDGAGALDCYFIEYRLNDGNASWVELHETLEEAKVLAHRSAVERKATGLAYDLFLTSLDEGDDASSALDEYRTLLDACLSGDEAQQRENEAVKEYWKRVTFRRIAKAQDYMVDELEHYQTPEVLESDMFVQFAHLMSNVLAAGQIDTNDMVLGVWGFFHNSAISSFEKPEALNEIVATVEPKFNTSWIDECWLRLSVEAPDKDDVLLLCEFASALYYADYNGALQALREIGEKWDSGSRLYKRAGAEAVKRCRQLDNSDDPVPLDLWLALGKMQYLNPFTVLDNVEPAIFLLPAGDVVAQSEAIREAWFSVKAEEYVKNRKNPHVKSVKALCKALGQMSGDRGTAASAKKSLRTFLGDRFGKSGDR